MDLIDIDKDDLCSMDTVVTKMHDFAKAINSRSAFIDRNDISNIANAFITFADWAKVANELAVEQAKKKAVEDFVSKIKEEFGGEK